MTWPCIFPRSSRPRETGSPGRARIFIYLALSVVFLLLSYQLVLNHESISRWAQQGFSLTDDRNATATATVAIDAITIHEDDPGEPVPPNEKELVFAAMRDGNMSWVEENVPEWPVNIYRADVPPGEDDLTVPMNKGNEAMVYLTYLIDRYWSLPDVVVFLHGGRYQWHNDNPLYDSVISIRDLNIHFVQQAGYVNLRCTWPVGCPVELEPARYLRDRPDDPVHPTAVEYPDRFQELFPGVVVPEVVGTPCCSQFAVSREKVHELEQEEYVRLRQWLIETELESGISGRILEYSWHMIFGKPAQYCLDARECYCNTYGYCNMTDFELNNQWIWRGLVLPEGWPETQGDNV